MGHGRYARAGNAGAYHRASDTTTQVIDPWRAILLQVHDTSTARTKKQTSIRHRAKVLLLPRGYNRLPSNLTLSKEPTVVGFRHYSALTLLPFYSVQKTTQHEVLCFKPTEGGGEGTGVGTGDLEASSAEKAMSVMSHVTYRVIVAHTIFAGQQKTFSNHVPRTAHLFCFFHPRRGRPRRSLNQARVRHRVRL